MKRMLIAEVNCIEAAYLRLHCCHTRQPALQNCFAAILSLG